ncbi:MAG: class I SAM-dependent methyltransferase [Patescibacteria group bacterium]|jgi:SAM-dependent methyltransferase
MNSSDWLLKYLTCPLLTNVCSDKLEFDAGLLRCGCGALYGYFSDVPYLRPIDNRQLPQKEIDGKYQEEMFVNMFALRQYGLLLRKIKELDGYRQIFDIQGGAENFYQTLLAAIHSYLGQAEVIVDIGCGTGRLTGEMAKASRSTKVIGIDYSSAMVSKAEQIILSSVDSEIIFPIRMSKIISINVSTFGWGLDNCAFIVGDGQYVPIKKATVDIATCINVFHRLADPKSLLSSVKRILKSNGILLVSNSYDWKEEFTPRDKWFDQFDSLLDFSEWQKLAEIDGIIYVTPTYNRKFDLAVNQIGIYRKIL